MSRAPRSLKPDATHEWLVGAYYRAYALHKDNNHLREAAELLADLRMRAETESDPTSMLRERIQRLHAQVLIRLKDPSGRQELIDLFERLGGSSATADPEAKEHARLLSDLCRDLTNIGLHNEAVEVASTIATRPVGRERHALRLTNLAAWLLQRAVALKVEGKKRDALADLDLAAEKIATAYDERVAAQEERPHDQRLEFRECEAVRVSIEVERGALEKRDLTQQINELRALLSQTPDFAAAPETRLQLAYRVGRLGVAHVLSSASSERDREIGRAYLRYAWDFTHNQLVRPWLPLYIAESASTAGDNDGAQLFAQAALDRLIPQTTTEYVVTQRLQEIAWGKRKSIRRGKA